MPKIPVPVLWNQDNAFINSALYSVDVNSIVVGTVSKPTKIFPPANLTPTLQSCVQIKEPNFGTLYLNMPLSAYQAAIRAGSQSTAPAIQTKIYTIASAVNTITDAALTGANIVAIWIGGIEQDITAITLSGSVLTFPNTFGIGDTAGVIYYIS